MSQAEFLIGRSGLDLQDDFYPEDLPEEWRFDYYSNLFRALSLPIDTDEDLEQIFAELADEEAGAFELVLSIQQAQLLDAQQLQTLLATVAEYQAYFILFCELDQTPKRTIMNLLEGYRFCFQSNQALDMATNSIVFNDLYLTFNRCPVLYSAEVWDEKQMRDYLQQLANIQTKTILICKFAERETLSKMRIIAEILGH